MRIDLGGNTTVDRLAGRGIERAEAAIARRNGATAASASPAVDLLSMAELRSSYGDPGFVGVRTEVSRAFAGDVSLALDRESASELVDDLVGDDPRHREARTELAADLLDAFVEGMADAIGTPIDRAELRPVEGSGVRFVEVPDDEADRAWGVLSIEAEFQVAGHPLEVILFVRPAPDDFEWFLAGPLGGAGLPVSLDQLLVYDHLTSAGTERASAHLSTLTGMDTRVEVSRSCFLPVEAVASRIGEGRYVGVVIETFGALSGHILVLFEAPSGRRVAETLVGADIEGDTVRSIHRSAIEEVGNIITSGLIDGWADVVGSTIEITPPRFVDDRGPAIVGPIADRIGRTRESAFVMDSTVVTDERDINCEILALPDEAEFTRTLTRIAGDAGPPGRPAEGRPRGIGDPHGGS